MRRLVALLRRRCILDESGVFIVLWALLLLAVLTMVAIVLDLSQLRQDRRQARLAADSAVTAGGLSLGRTAAGRLAACESAWTYAAENLGFDPPPASPCSPYNSVNGGSDCIVANPNTAIPQSVSAALGRYTIEIVNPVSNGSDLLNADLIGPNLAQVPNSNTGLNDSDGEPCTRIGVRITVKREMTFARVIGVNDRQTISHSVSRAAVDEGQLRPNLVVLDPHGCDALKATGTPAIEVIGQANLRAGIVIVNDAANCTGNGNYVLNVGTGNSGGHVTAAVNGDMFMKAGGGSCTGNACDPGQQDQSGCWNIDPNLTTCTGYSPAPLPLLATINRSRVDYIFNCRADYTVSGGHYVNVTIDGSPMGVCPSPQADYINALYTQVITNNGLRPSGTVQVIGNNPNQPCPSPLPVLTPPDPVEFQCRLPNNSNLTITTDAWFRQNSFQPGVVVVNGNAVFDGDISLGSGNSLEVGGNSLFLGSVSVSGNASGGGLLSLHGRPGAYPVTCQPLNFLANIASCVKLSGHTAASGPTPSSGAAFSFMMGTLSQNGGTVLLDRVMVYGGIAGHLDRGGGGTMTWLPPSAGNGPFVKLSFWSDTSGTHVMGGGGDLTVDGIYFAPNATYELGGNSPTLPQDAQFWAFRLHAAGNATFRMTPDPDLISVPVGPVVRLIR